MQANILVVDDEPSIRTILEHQLAEAGYTVSCAASGEEALAHLTGELPDLVLLDVMMPDLDGHAVLKRIRAESRTHHLPVIMLTARGERKHVLEGLEAGANDYIVKPFSREELLLRVGNLLELSRWQLEANPLTGLPGNRAITEELRRRLAGEEPFGYLYIDLDGFKPYNDHYGYARGDKVLTTLADILVEAARATDPRIFVGHVGGDDFVALAPAAAARPLADAVVAAFAERRRFLYDPEDWSRGYLELPDRLGIVRRFPPVALTIVVVVDRERRFCHPGELQAAVVELKRYGKQQPGDIVVQERRQAADVPAGAGVGPTGETVAGGDGKRETDGDT